MFLPGPQDHLRWQEKYRANGAVAPRRREVMECTSTAGQGPRFLEMPDG